MSTTTDLVEILKPNRVFAIVRECSRDLAFPVYVAGSTISYAVWESVFGISKTPEDLDLVYFDPSGDFCDEVVEARIHACTGMEVHAYNQAKIHEIPKFSYRPPRKSLADAVANYCDTPACVVARLLDSGDFEVIAPYGVEDLFDGHVVVTMPEYTAEVIKRARKKQWQATWPQIRVMDGFGVDLHIPPLI